VAGWKRRSTRQVYRNSFIAAYEDLWEVPRGGTMAFFRLKSPSFACIVPVSDDNKVVFVREYRPAIRTTLLEIPGGRIEPGESPHHGARRELEEETGYRAGALRSLGWFYPSPYRSSNRAHLFLARKLRAGKRNLDATEDLQNVEVPVPVAYQRMRSGRIRDPATMIGLSRAEPFLNDVRGLPRSKPLIPRVVGASRSGVG
jgi:ADP-ribose pyrophosphatase